MLNELIFFFGTGKAHKKQGQNGTTQGNFVGEVVVAGKQIPLGAFIREPGKFKIVVEVHKAEDGKRNQEAQTNEEEPVGQSQLLFHE